MTLSCVLISSDKTPLEEREESNADEFSEEGEKQLQSPPSPELHSCFIQAGNMEIKGVLHH